MIRRTGMIRPRSHLRLLLAAAVLGQTACAAIDKETGAVTPAQLVGTTWMTITVEGQPAPVDVESTLTFAPDRLSGNGGCNPFFAPLQMAANELVIGPIGRGRRACRPEVMAAEDAFLGALQQVASYRGTDLFLYLSDGTGRERMSLGRVLPGSPPNEGAPSP